MRPAAAAGGGSTAGDRVLPGTVTVTRPRHPLEGRELRVLGGMRRHGQPELLLVLPDGAKRLVPAAWTDLRAGAGQRGGDGPGTLGVAGGPAGPVRAGFGALRPRAADEREQAARKPPCQGGRSCSLFSSVCCRTRFRRHRRT